MTVELIILCKTRTEEQIKRAVNYLHKQFPMANDSKLTYRQTTKDDPEHLRNSGWIAVIPERVEYWNQFSATIDKMRTAAQDYENGYNDAKKGL